MSPPDPDLPSPPVISPPARPAVNPSGHIIISPELRPAETAMPVEPTPFMPTALENCRWLLLGFGWLPLVYIGYRAGRGSLDLGERFMAVSFGVLAYEGCLLLIGAALVPLRQLDKKRLARFVAEGNLTRLLEFVHSAMVYSDWERGCAAILRLGPATAPHLIEALDPDVKILKNLAGRPVPSTSTLRAAAVYCLGRLKVTAATEAMHRRLDDPAFDVRQHTCDALAELRDESALPKLQELAANDPHDDVKKAASAAVAGITSALAPSH